MAAKQQPDGTGEIGSQVQAWRVRVLNILLVVVLIAATWRIAQSIIQAIRAPEWWPQTLPYLAVYALLLAIVVLRRLDHRLRAWGLILVGYGMAVMTLAMFGLVGNGLTYLLVLPLLGVMLIGPRSCLVMAALSLATYAAFAAFAALGWLAGWLVLAGNPVTFEEWLGVGLMFGGLLIMLVVMQWLFDRAQTQALVQANRAARRLGEAHAELEIRAGQLDRYAGLLEAAAHIAHETASLLDRETMVLRSAVMIRDQLQLDAVAIYLADQPHGPIELRATAGSPAPAPPGVGLPPSVALAVQQQSVQAGPADGGPAELYEMALPLATAGQVTGAVHVQRAAAPWTVEEGAVLRLIAGQLAVAVENGRLFAATQSSLKELDAVYRHYTAAAWQEFPAPGAQAAAWQGGSGTIAAGAWQALFEQTRASGSPATAEVDGHYLLAMPVKLRDLPVGVLGLHRPMPAGPWHDDQVAAVATVADRLALAAENLRLLDETQRRAAREQWLGQVSDRMQRAADMSSLLRIAADELNKALGGSRAYVRLVGEAKPAGGQAPQEMAAG